MSLELFVILGKRYNSIYGNFTFQVYDPVNNICEERIINGTWGPDRPDNEEEFDDSELFDNIAKILPKVSFQIWKSN